MFTNRTRLFIGFIFLLSLILLTYLRMFPFAAVALMMITLLTWDYFKQGTLVVASRFFHHKQYEDAENALLEIKNPKWLSNSRRGYYEFLMGGVCLQKQDYSDAEKHYEVAAQYPLRSVNDHVATLVHVANINIRLGNFEKAEAYLQLTEKHQENINAKMRDVIARLHLELKKREKKDLS